MLYVYKLLLVVVEHLLGLELDCYPSFVLVLVLDERTWTYLAVMPFRPWLIVGQPLLIVAFAWPSFGHQLVVAFRQQQLMLTNVVGLVDKLAWLLVGRSLAVVMDPWVSVNKTLHQACRLEMAIAFVAVHVLLRCVAYVDWLNACDVLLYVELERHKVVSSRRLNRSFP